DRQRPDGVGLVQDHQQLTTLLEAGEQVPQLGVVLGEGFVEEFVGGGMEGGGVVGGVGEMEGDD
ncbi:hypothetical protein, partial [Kocuria rhizophila]|uniref:hypothetical protein n=1 Tax=Kocuria rhizophila TaxID=72000 RepID=UPI001C92D9FD